MLVPFLLILITACQDANVTNLQAIEELKAGKRTTANAAWWGFNPDDATHAIQAAIDSGAQRVIIPNVGQDWIVKPIKLASNQELVLEKGVVVTAMRGEYRGGGDSVFRAVDVENLVIQGYDATLRMHKEDYIVGLVLEKLGWQRWYGPYTKAEWRMTLSLNGCKNVKILGLTLKDSGGDGIYIAGSGSGPCRNIEIRDVLCDNHYRQGMSVVSVDGLLVEGSQFNNTWGTPPSAGVDIEPDQETEIIKNLVFRNCQFLDNYGDGIEVFLPHVKQDISILFENCRVSSRRGAGIRVSKIYQDGPQGFVEFRNCLVSGTEAYGIKVQDKVASGAVVRFSNCRLRDTARDKQAASAWAPIWLQSTVEGTFGGIEFIDCIVEDARVRSPIALDTTGGIEAITGTLQIRNSFGAQPVPELGRSLRIQPFD